MAGGGGDDGRLAISPSGMDRRTGLRAHPLKRRGPGGDGGTGGCGPRAHGGGRAVDDHPRPISRGAPAGSRRRDRRRGAARSRRRAAHHYEHPPVRRLDPVRADAVHLCAGRPHARSGCSARMDSMASSRARSDTGLRGRRPFRRRVASRPAGSGPRRAARPRCAVPGGSTRAHSGIAGRSLHCTRARQLAPPATARISRRSRRRPGGLVLATSRGRPRARENGRPNWKPPDLEVSRCACTN